MVSRATYFFMSSVDEADLLQVIQDRGDRIYDIKANEWSVEDVLHSDRRQFFVPLPGLKGMHISEAGFIEQLDSEVMELDLCRRKDKEIEVGRIWISSGYYDKQGTWFMKRKEFLDMYTFYAKWIKKRYRINRDKHFYIGDDAYRLYKEEGWVVRDISVPIEFD